MREIEFRAKRKDNKYWVEGGFFRHLNRTLSPMGDRIRADDFTYYIYSTGFSDWNMPTPIDQFEVEPESVCEYTGYQAENGRIFENHIIGFMNYYGITEEYRYAEGVVTLKDGAWIVSLIGEDSEDEFFGCTTMKYVCKDGKVRIMGNTIDNPERLNPEFRDENTKDLITKWQKNR